MAVFSVWFFPLHDHIGWEVKCVTKYYHFELESQMIRGGCGLIKCKGVITDDTGQLGSL